jgi:cation transport ATPase
MFDLENAITEWREQMLAAGIKTPVPLDELEHHLREEIRRQTALGLSAPDAFPAAAKNIGLGEALNAEFEKLDRSDALIRWRSVGIGYSFFAAAFSAFLITLCLIEPRISSAFKTTDRILAFAAIATSFFSIAGWRYGSRFLPVIRNSRTRVTIGITCSLLGAGWMLAYILFIIPHQMHSWINHFFVLFVWALAVMSVLGGVGYGLEKAAKEQTTTADS